MTTADTSQQRRLKKQSDALHERYGKPLEAEHRGEYVAIAKDGRTVLGRDMLDVVERSVRELGPGADIFEVGSRAVGKWR